MHMPYRQGYRLPDHHYEDRHDAPVYNRKCICELVGPNLFPYDTPDRFPGPPISIATVLLMVLSLEILLISLAGPCGIHVASVKGESLAYLHLSINTRNGRCPITSVEYSHPQTVEIWHSFCQSTPVGRW